MTGDSQVINEQNRKLLEHEYEYFQNEKGNVKVIPIKLNSETEKKIFDLINKPIHSLPDIDEKSFEKSLEKPSELLKNDKIDSEIFIELQQRTNCQLQFKSIVESQRKFPVFKKKQEILDAVSKNQVVLVTGEPSKKNLVILIFDYYL